MNRDLTYTRSVGRVGLDPCQMCGTMRRMTILNLGRKGLRIRLFVMIVSLNLLKRNLRRRGAAHEEKTGVGYLCWTNGYCADHDHLYILLASLDTDTLGRLSRIVYL